MSQTVIYCLSIEHFVKFIVLINHVTQIAVTYNIIYLPDVSLTHNYKAPNQTLIDEEWWQFKKSTNPEYKADIAAL